MKREKTVGRMMKKPKDNRILKGKMWEKDDKETHPDKQREIQLLDTGMRSAENLHSMFL